MTAALSFLDDHVEVLSGFAFESKYFNDERRGLPLIRIRNVVTGSSDTFYEGSFDSRFLIQRGEIVIGMDGGFNRARWGSGPSLLNQRVCRIRSTSPELDEQYLFYFLPSALKLIEDRTPFVTVKHLSSKDIASIPIPLPPIGEQRRIAAILDQADDLRRKRRLALKKLNDLAWASFLKLFGDPFSPEPSLPMRTVGDVTTYIRYGTGSPPPYSTKGVPFIRATNIKSGRIVDAGLKFIDTSACASISKCRVATGNLIVVRSGVNTGECAIVHPEFDGAYAAYDLIVDCDALTGTYLNDLLNSSGGRRATARVSRRAAQAHLNSEQLATFRIPWPPKTTLQEFFIVKTSLSLLREKMVRSASLADELLASLQHHAFAGTLTSLPVKAALASV